MHGWIKRRLSQHKVRIVLVTEMMITEMIVELLKVQQQ
jgi:hypothetical protein